MARVALRPMHGRAWKIANSKGLPATLGCVARTYDARTVLLSTWHVLFGEGSSWNDIVWLVNESQPERRYEPIGRTLQGKVGIVRFNGDDYFVDCAIATCGFRVAQPCGPLPVVGHETAEPGSVVTKVGAATGTTSGVIVDAAYCGSTRVGARTQSAPRQLLVRALDPSRPFSDEGDSGALLVNSANRAVGLLWGTNSRGDGVACHMAPVLRALDLTLLAADL